MIRRWLPLLGAAVLGAVLVSVVLGLMNGSSDSSRDRGGATDSESVSAGRSAPQDEVDLAVFLDLWEASFTGPYVVRGTVTRTRGSGDDLVRQSVDFRHARREDRTLDQMGDLAVVVAAGESRDCQLFDNGAVACAEPTAARTAPEERLAMAEEMRDDYLLFTTDDPSCLEVIGRGPVTVGRWGQSSTVCFDDRTGAVIRVETFTGTTRTVLVAEAISDAPSGQDLEPGW